MEQHDQLKTVLMKLEENSRKQLFYSRVQCIFSIICAVCCVILLVTVMRFLPQLQVLLQEANAVLINLETVTDFLAELDVTQMVENINQLVTTSQTGVEEALEKINEIDLDSLNQAVQDLSAVVDPLAKLVKRLW